MKKKSFSLKAVEEAQDELTVSRVDFIAWDCNTDCHVKRTKMKRNESRLVSEKKKKKGWGCRRASGQGSNLNVTHKLPRKKIRSPRILRNWKLCNQSSSYEERSRLKWMWKMKPERLDGLSLKCWSDHPKLRWVWCGCGVGYRPLDSQSRTCLRLWMIDWNLSSVF